MISHQLTQTFKVSNKLRLIIWIAVVLIVSSVFVLRQDSNELVNPFVEPDLKLVVDNLLKDTRGKYGIYIKNLKTQEDFFLNEHEKFEPGSLYKLWLMGAVFEKIKSGSLKEEKTLSEKIEDLNKIFEISTDEAELKDGEIEMSVNSALHQMITISHNYAALLLTKEVGVSKVNEFIKKNGFNESSIGDELKTTASDIGRFYEMLYEGKLIDEEYSKRMLELLGKQEINDRIPKYLPENTRVAHKTGDIGFFEHDGGIVYSEKGDYIIVVLTETELPEKAGEKIADLSKTVYEYFQN